jgi:hypothetical protein
MNILFSDPRQIVGLIAGLVFLLIILLENRHWNSYWKEHPTTILNKNDNFSYWKLKHHHWNFFEIPKNILKTIWPPSES